MPIWAWCHSWGETVFCVWPKTLGSWYFSLPFLVVNFLTNNWISVGFSGNSVPFSSSRSSPCISLLTLRHLFRRRSIGSLLSLRCVFVWFEHRWLSFLAFPGPLYLLFFSLFRPLDGGETSDVMIGRDFSDDGRVRGAEAINGSKVGVEDLMSSCRCPIRPDSTTSSIHAWVF